MRRPAFMMFAMLFVVVFSIRVTLADEFQSRIDSARETFEKAMGEIAEEAGKSLGQLEDAARKKGDEEKIKTIEQERLEFDKNNILPPSLPKRVLDKSGSAIKRLRDQFGQIKKDCLKKKEDAKAEEVERELERLIASSFQVREDAIMDLGSVWKGRDQVVGDTRDYLMTGTVTKVEGNRFTLSNERSDGGLFDYECERKNNKLQINSVTRVRGGGIDGDKNSLNGKQVQMNAIISVRGNTIVIQYDRPLDGGKRMKGSMTLKREAQPKQKQ